MALLLLHWPGVVGSNKSENSSARGFRHLYGHARTGNKFEYVGDSPSGLWFGGMVRWTNASFIRLESMRSMYNQVNNVKWSYQDVGGADYSKGKHLSVDMEETLEEPGEIETQSG